MRRNQVIREALHHAELDRSSYLDAIAGCDMEEDEAEATALLKAIARLSSAKRFERGEDLRLILYYGEQGARSYLEAIEASDMKQEIIETERTIAAIRKLRLAEYGKALSDTIFGACDWVGEDQLLNQPA